MKLILKRIFGLSIGAVLTICVGTKFCVSYNYKTIKTSAEEENTNGTPAVGTIYKIVTSSNELVSGGNYTFIYDSSPTRSSYCYQITNNVVSSGKIAAEQINYVSYYDPDSRSIASTSSTLNFELGEGSTSDSWTLKTTNYSGTNGYLSSTGILFSGSLVVQTNPANIALSEEGKTDHIYYVKFSNNCLLDCTTTITSSSYKFGASNSSSGISIFKAEEAKTAKDWADNFLSTTADPCTDPIADNHEALAEIWASTESFYNQLDDTNKALLLNSDGTETDYGEAIRRYDHIMKRYNALYSSSINNYINRTIQPVSPIVVPAPNNSILIIIVSIVSFVCISTVTCCLIVKHNKKKSKEIEK